MNWKSQLRIRPKNNRTWIQPFRKRKQIGIRPFRKSRARRLKKISHKISFLLNPDTDPNFFFNRTRIRNSGLNPLPIDSTETVLYTLVDGNSPDSVESIMLRMFFVFAPTFGGFFTCVVGAFSSVDAFAFLATLSVAD